MREPGPPVILAILAAASPALTGAVPSPDMTPLCEKPCAAVADKGKLLSLDEHLHSTHEGAPPPSSDMPPGQASTDMPPSRPPWRPDDSFFLGTPRTLLLSSVAGSA